MLPGDPGFLASVPLPAKTSLCLPDHRWRTELLGGAGTRRQEESRVIQALTCCFARTAPPTSVCCTAVPGCRPHPPSQQRRGPHRPPGPWAPGPLTASTPWLRPSLFSQGSTHLSLTISLRFLGRVDFRLLLVEHSQYVAGRLSLLYYYSPMID